MRAILYDGELRFRPDYPDPVPKDGFALVRVEYAGVCATDLEISKGYMGFKGVIGHEFTGVVERGGDAALAGKRVVGEINAGCGGCGYCRAGLSNHCAERSVLGIIGMDGAFADFLTLPLKNLHVVPDSVQSEEAVFTEPLAAAFEIIEQVRMGEESRVCVLGDGRLGLLTAQVLGLTGCSLTVAGRHAEKLKILEKRGIRTVLGTDALLGEFDIVVDCTGSPSGLTTALDIVRPRGTVVLKTTVAESEGANGRQALNRVVIDEVTLVGSRCGPFAPALKALSSGSVDVRPLITKIFPLEEGVEAVEYAGQKGVLKVLLKT
jgi:threonine dehydrogenase-like Zn-dependent dehydrogenase